MVKIKFGHVMAVLMDSHARNRKKNYSNHVVIYKKKERYKTKAIF
jgi:hypothetical protein